MNITVEVIGLKGLEDALADAGPKLARRTLRKALKEAGQPMLNSVKSKAPVMAKGTPQRKPGELRDALDMTIKMSAKEESGTARIGIRKDKSKGKQDPSQWGSYVEFGSIHGAAQPFMRPGFDATKDASLDKFTVVLRDGVESLKK
jgi:HK97 gp10 family phage protein